MSDSQSTTISKLAEVMSEVVFLPTPEQRRVKAVLWTQLTDNPAYDPSRLSKELAVQLTGDHRVGKWWQHEAGFKDWLQNKDEFRQRLEYLTQLALDALESVLVDSDPKSSGAKVSAAKLLMEVANKMPQRNARELYHDERIQKMSAQELRSYITKQTKLVAGRIPGEE